VRDLAGDRAYPSDPDSALDVAIDPVARPGEYQELMLALVGDQDPARVQADLSERLGEVIEEAGSHLRTRPAAGEWSIVELLGHLLDAELVSAARYRWILAQDEPRLVGYDENQWVQGLRHNEADPGSLLAFFRILRRANIELWEASSEAERARVGVHEERGPESYQLIFRMIAGHGLFHLAQMRRTLRAVAGGSTA
jgi:DinB superfamily